MIGAILSQRSDWPTIDRSCCWWMWSSWLPCMLPFSIWTFHFKACLLSFLSSSWRNFPVLQSGLGFHSAILMVPTNLLSDPVICTWFLQNSLWHTLTGLDISQNLFLLPDVPYLVFPGNHWKYLPFCRMSDPLSLKGHPFAVAQTS